MRIYRLLVEIDPQVWTYVVSASDAIAAWKLVLASLAEREGPEVRLEELEATGFRRGGARPAVLQRWLSAGPPRAA